MSNTSVQSMSIGIANLPNQLHKLTLKKTTPFTLIIAGESGLGKSTFVNTLLTTTILRKKDYSKRNKQVEKTTKITQTKAIVEEKLFKVELTIVDTPGFGDFVNNSNTWSPVVDFIDAQYQSYYNQDKQPDRSKLTDVRVNACIYFIRPTGHGLSLLDIEAMREIGSRCNLIPVIAKADTLSPLALESFKTRIKETIHLQQINVYSPVVDRNDFLDAALVHDIIDAMPFTVIGSEEFVTNKEGAKVRGREYPWGIVEVENEQHCDFVKLRNLLIRTHMLDLINTTEYEHYERFKGEIINKKNDKKKENPKYKEEEEALKKKFTEQVRIEESRFRQWELKLIAERDRLNKDLEDEHTTVRQLESDIEALQNVDNGGTKSARK